MTPTTAPFASSGSAKKVLAIDLTFIKPFVLSDSNRPNTVPLSQSRGPGRKARYGSFRIVDDLCHRVTPGDVARGCGVLPAAEWNRYNTVAQWCVGLDVQRGGSGLR